MLGEMVQSQSGSLQEGQEPYRRKDKRTVDLCINTGGDWLNLHIRVHTKLNTLLTCALLELRGAEQEKHGCSEHYGL